MEYDYYNKHGGRYFYKFIKRNPEFDNPQFLSFVVKNNKGDRDSGEVQDIAKHEVLRLAYEYTEMQWRFPNVHGEQHE